MSKASKPTKKRKPLAWTEDGIPACFECADHLFTTPFLAESFHSVGIEYPEGSDGLAQRYFQAYHDRGHPKP